MNAETARGWVIGSWLVMIGLITIRQIAGDKKGMPQPGSYLGSAILFTMLIGLASLTPALGTTIAVGTVVGAAVAPYMKGQSTGIIDTMATWLDGISK